MADFIGAITLAAGEVHSLKQLILAEVEDRMTGQTAQAKQDYLFRFANWRAQEVAIINRTGADDLYQIDDYLPRDKNGDTALTSVELAARGFLLPATTPPNSSRLTGPVDLSLRMLCSVTGGIVDLEANTG